MMIDMSENLAKEIQRNFEIEKIKKQALEVSQFVAFVTFWVAFLILIPMV